MKVALITDLHFGYRNNPEYFEYFDKFYQSFFRYLLDNNIEDIICLGDTFDNRRAITIETLDWSIRHFFDVLENEGFSADFIIGNHDTRYKNTNTPNSPELLLSGYRNIHVYAEPEEVFYNSKPFLYIPWITEENYDATMNAIKTTSAEIAFGHLELNGFDMYSGILSEGGMDRSIFKKFEHVYSGHFHKKSTQGNITYLGTAYQLYWSDVNEVKGFHVFDTVSYEMEFIPNPHNMFMEVEYSDLAKLDSESISGKQVRVFITDEIDHKHLGKQIERLESDCFSIDVIQHAQVNSIDEPQYELKVTGVVDMLRQYIDVMETSQDKEAIRKIMGELYISSVKGG